MSACTWTRNGYSVRISEKRWCKNPVIAEYTNPIYWQITIAILFLWIPACHYPKTRSGFLTKLMIHCNFPAVFLNVAPKANKNRAKATDFCLINWPEEAIHVLAGLIILFSFLYDRIIWKPTNSWVTCHIAANIYDNWRSKYPSTRKDRPLEAKFENGCLANFLFFALWGLMEDLSIIYSFTRWWDKPQRQGMVRA